MKIEIVSSQESFASLREPWSELLEKNPAVDFFLSHPWLYSWWEVFARGRELSIFVCRHGSDGRVVGILPAFMENGGGLSSRRMRLLGSEFVSSDFLGILVDPHSKEETLKALLDALHHGEQLWDLLDFEALDSQGDLPALLHETVAKGEGRRILIEPGETCPALVLPGDWETYLRALTKKMRSNVRYFRKVLERRGAVEYEMIESPEQFEGALSDVMRLRRRWIEARGYSSPCPFPLYADFHRRLWRRSIPEGGVHIRFLRYNGRRIAFAYLLRLGASVYYYQTAFEQEFASRSVGSVLLGHLIEEAIAWGCTRFEFLRGDEQYKFKWGEVRERRLARVKVYNATGAGRWSYGIDTALGSARRMVKGLAPGRTEDRGRRTEDSKLPLLD